MSTSLVGLRHTYDRDSNRLTRKNVVAEGAGEPQDQSYVYDRLNRLESTQYARTKLAFWVRRFYEELRELGFSEGVNLIVERFSAEGRTDRFAAVAAAPTSSCRTSTLS